MASKAQGESWNIRVRLDSFDTQQTVQQFFSILIVHLQTAYGWLQFEKWTVANRVF